MTDIYAHLPALHLFAGNAPPKSLDGSSHAYGRRLILVKTESLTIDGPRIVDFEQKVLSEEMPGILARALRGLERLLSNDGLYTFPDTSHDQVREMEMDSDSVGQFLDEVNHGEVRTEKAQVLVIGDDARIERPDLWAIFNMWQESSNTHNRLISKHNFFNQIESRGFQFKRDEKGRYFRGLGLRVESDPIG